MVLVDTDAICAAIKDVFEDTRAILEPAGALAVAGAKEYAKRHKLKDKTLVAIASGANVNFDRLRFVAERAEIGEQREAVLAVTLPEKPGSYKKFVSLIGSRNITGIQLSLQRPAPRRMSSSASGGNRAESLKLVDSLEKHGYATLDLTDDEMAKLHIRHLVGGHAPGSRTRSSIASSFPSVPGALMNFLNSMSAGWNISLFPLPQPRRRLRSRAGRHAGAGEGEGSPSGNS